MTERRDLLIEIGTEELPPMALVSLADAFVKGVVEGLSKAQVVHGRVQRFATPRRLAMLIDEVGAQQPDRENLKRGPAIAAARTAEGTPTPAALGFARSCGVDFIDLETLTTEQGSWLCHRVQLPGQRTTDIIPDLVSSSLARLPIPKRMRWGDRSVEFVRPVHWAVLLFGEELIAAEILGVKAGRQTFGHRFHHPDGLPLTHASDYEQILFTHGRVQANFDARRADIVKQVQSAGAGSGGRVQIDESLLDEVTALVEWPVAIAGDFDPKFLAVPAEVLIATMKDQQRYFHIVNGDGKLLPRFITVANVVSTNPDTIKRGNERVVTPRLTDAAFFWEQDRRQTLYSRREQLKGVVFQKQLGTLFEKSERVSCLAGVVAETIGADKAAAMRAGALAKCDLLSSLVGEFPELQGVMGRYYAQHDGELPAVADAIAAHYRPRFAGDTLPNGLVGIAVALADKLDTLVGIFGIGQVPTGDKDPFALRRAALGCLRIMVEAELPLDLAVLLPAAADQYQGRLTEPEVVSAVLEFMLERLRGYLVTGEVTPDAFEAVLARQPSRPLDFSRRLQAVMAFRQLPDSASLAAANKRIANILKQSAAAESAVAAEEFAVERLVEPAERELAIAFTALQAQVREQLAGGDYRLALRTLAGLRPQVDAFFDTVLVMAEDERVRRNRIALLQMLYTLFLEVADISRLHS